MDDPTTMLIADLNAFASYRRVTELGDKSAMLTTAAALLTQQAARIAELERTLAKIDDIRDSIIGYQTVNWSAHIYPLVAALDEAGHKGKGYDEASKLACTQVDRIGYLERALATSRAAVIEECVEVCEGNVDKAQMANAGHGYDAAVWRMISAMQKCADDCRALLNEGGTST